MTLRQKVARALRKWADLIDPRTNPSDELTIRINCDSSDFDQSLSRVQARLLELGRMLRRSGSTLEAVAKE